MSFKQSKFLSFHQFQRLDSRELNRNDSDDDDDYDENDDDDDEVDDGNKREFEGDCESSSEGQPEKLNCSFVQVWFILRKLARRFTFFSSNFDVERGIRSLFVYFALSFISYVLRVLLSITMSNHVYVPERGREKLSENDASFFFSKSV